MSIAGFLIGLAAVSGTQDSTARTLLRLEDGWAAALVRRDSAYFHRSLASGFIYSENERTMTREAVLRDLVGGTDTVSSAHNEDMEVHEFGETAVVTGWLIVRGRGAGRSFEHRYRFTDTWVRQAGQWRIVAAHDFLAPS